MDNLQNSPATPLQGFDAIESSGYADPVATSRDRENSVAAS